MKIFNIVYYVRKASEGAGLLVRKPLVPNANYILGPLIHKGEFKLWEGIKSRSGRFFFDRIFIG
jgi:hypothetical protein